MKRLIALVWLLLVWLLAIFAGLGVIHYLQQKARTKPAGPAKEAVCAPPKVEYKATRRLASNHRLAAADLKRSDASAPKEKKLTNLYLTRAVEKEGGFSRADLRAAPVLETAAGRVPLLLPLPASRPLGQWLNAGSVIDVWRGGQPLLESARVLAVLCGTESPACIVAVEAPRSVMPEWGQGDNTKIQILVRKIEP